MDPITDLITIVAGDMVMDTDTDIHTTVGDTVRDTTTDITMDTGMVTQTEDMETHLIITITAEITTDHTHTDPELRLEQVMELVVAEAELQVRI